MKKIISFILALVLMTALLATPALAEVRELSGHMFKLNDTDGIAFDLSECEGKVVFINFWATWCRPCCYEMPALNDLAAHYADAEDVVIVAVNCGDAKKSVASFMKKKGYSSLRALCDVKGSVATDFGVESIPYTLIYGKDGKLAESVVGVKMDVSKICDHYVELIEALR